MKIRRHDLQYTPMFLFEDLKARLTVSRCLAPPVTMEIGHVLFHRRTLTSVSGELYVDENLRYLGVVFRNSLLINEKEPRKSETQGLDWCDLLECNT